MNITENPCTRDKEMMFYHQAIGQMATYHFVKPKISLLGSH